MKNIIPLLLIASICSISTALYAQTTLAPCDNEFSSEYYRSVDEIIDGAVKQPSELSLTVIPAFIPEYGVRLAAGKVYFVGFKSSLWYHKDEPHEGEAVSASTPAIKTQVYSATLNPSLGTRVKQVYKTAITNAKPSEMFGLDGVSYRFSLPSMGCGQTWSPDEASPNGRLVVLLDLLISHSKLSQVSKIKRSEKNISKTLDAIERANTRGLVYFRFWPEAATNQF